MLPFCVMSQEIAPCDITTLREDRHAAEKNIVAEATRRRQRSSRASFFLDFLQELFLEIFLVYKRGKRYNGTRDGAGGTASGDSVMQKQ